MGPPDDAAETRAQGWRTLAGLHARIEDELERALQKQHGLSVSEYNVLDQAQPTHDAVLMAALGKAAELTELAPLVGVLDRLTMKV